MWRLEFPYYVQRFFLIDDVTFEYITITYKLDFLSYWLMRIFFGRKKLEDLANRNTLDFNKKATSMTSIKSDYNQ